MGITAAHFSFGCSNTNSLSLKYGVLNTLLPVLITTLSGVTSKVVSSAWLFCSMARTTPEIANVAAVTLALAVMLITSLQASIVPGLNMKHVQTGTKLVLLRAGETNSSNLTNSTLF